MQGIFGKKERGERSEQVRHLMSTHPAFSFFKSSILAPSSSREGLSQVKSNLPCASCFERALAKVMDGIEKDQLLFPGCFTYCLRELEIAFEHLIVRAAALQNEKVPKPAFTFTLNCLLYSRSCWGWKVSFSFCFLGCPMPRPSITPEVGEIVKRKVFSYPSSSSPPMLTRLWTRSRRIWLG